MDSGRRAGHSGPAAGLTVRDDYGRDSRRDPLDARRPSAPSRGALFRRGGGPVTEPIKKITTKAGETRYRFVIDVGTKPNGKRDQRCYTFGNFKDARAARAKIIADRNR